MSVFSFIALFTCALLLGACQRAERGDTAALRDDFGA